MWTPDDIKKLVTQNKIVIFAKGTKEQPMCGFSHRAIQVMQQVGKPFEVVNIFDDPSIRPALVEATGWPTTPQVFIGGEMVGGSDIVLEMLQSGELQKKVDAALA
jgi:monothiol glutaredoxin